MVKIPYSPACIVQHLFPRPCSNSPGSPSQSELPRNSRAFVTEASRLKAFGFTKETVLKIFRYSDSVFEFVKLVGLFQMLKIDDYVLRDLIDAAWEE